MNNKIWILLIVVSTVIGMTMPAMANPFEDSQNSANAENNKQITVNVDGANTATADILQELNNDEIS